MSGPRSFRGAHVRLLRLALPSFAIRRSGVRSPRGPPLPTTTCESCLRRLPAVVPFCYHSPSQCPNPPIDPGSLSLRRPGGPQRRGSLPAATCRRASPSAWGPSGPGIPTHTFVRPIEYPALLVALRTPGRGVVVEGPSGIGKTTAVTRALEELGLERRSLDSQPVDATTSTSFVSCLRSRRSAPCSSMTSIARRRGVCRSRLVRPSPGRGSRARRRAGGSGGGSAAAALKP